MDAGNFLNSPPDPICAESLERAMRSVPRVFGQVVCQERKARGLSQEELAEMAGIGRKYLSRVERGHSEPGLDVMCRLALALGVMLSSLVRLAETSPECRQ